MLDHLVILGATGDLASRLVLPALAQLLAAGELPDTLRITGTGRDEVDDAAFRDELRAGLDEHASDIDDEVTDDLLGRVTYAAVDVTDPGSLAEVLHADDGPVAVHVALPPQVFADTLRGLADAGVPDGSVVAIEKPFGRGQEEARELNTILAERLRGTTVVRIDHFLHKQTVQNVLGLRFGNRLLEPTWSARDVERVDVHWDETLTLEGRAGYYDDAGALRDMLQNHLLQVLCLTAMEPPTSLDADALRAARLGVLRAIRTPDRDWVAEHTVRARYGAGEVGGDEVVAYADADGVEPSNETETFAQVTLAVDTWRWAGVPFTLRSGKAMSSDRAEVVVTFREVPHPVFAGQDGCEQNRLTIALGDAPDATLDLNVNSSGDLFGLSRTELAAALPTPRYSAYAGLMRDVLDADPSLSVGAEEAEQAWRVMEPVLAAWDDGAVELREYAAGSKEPRDWDTVGEGWSPGA